MAFLLIFWHFWPKNPSFYIIWKASLYFLTFCVIIYYILSIKNVWCGSAQLPFFGIFATFPAETTFPLNGCVVHFNFTSHLEPLPTQNCFDTKHKNNKKTTNLRVFDVLCTTNLRHNNNCQSIQWWQKGKITKATFHDICENRKISISKRLFLNPLSHFPTISPMNFEIIYLTTK